MPSVLQPWLEQLPIRMQSTLLLSLRGPDTHCCLHIKIVQRWMRGLTFIPGSPFNVKEFMTGVDDLPELVEKGSLAKELEFCTQHFYSHLMHGLEVLGYEHPDFISRNIALTFYVSMANLMHLEHESKAVFSHRLKTLKWPNGEQPTNFDEAKLLLEKSL